MKTAYGYMADNFLLTQQLVNIPHRKFIFVSTLAVYPPTGRAVPEDEDIDLLPLTGPYAFTKLFSDLIRSAKTWIWSPYGSPYVAKY